MAGRDGGDCWPCKLSYSGTSALSGPADVSQGPFRTLNAADCRYTCTALVDAGQNVYLASIVLGIEVLHPDGTPKYLFDWPGVSGTPALIDGVCYGADVGGTAFAFTAATGEEVWRSHYCEAVGDDPWSVGPARGGVVVPGRARAASEHDGLNNLVFLLDSRDGHVKWKHELPGHLYFFTPSTADDLLVFGEMTGAVDCLRCGDGKLAWQFKPQGFQVTTGGPVVHAESRSVFAASNRPAKKEWNKPCGGKGVVRGFDLADGKQRWEATFDLEANAVPAVAPSGPSGKPVVIVGLGSNCGVRGGAKPVGDYWAALCVGLDAATGAELWRWPLELEWHHPTAAGTFDEEFPSYTTAWSNPVVGADGKVYMVWQGGKVLVFNGATGEGVSMFDCGCNMVGAPAIGPGSLVLAMRKHCLLFRDAFPEIADVRAALRVPFAESGTEHFWPDKMGSHPHTGSTAMRAPADLSKPAWSISVPNRWPKPHHAFFYDTPVIDAQRNIYVNPDYEDLLVLRPDGTLRASVNVGPRSSNPALFGTNMYLANRDGVALSISIETFETNWRRKFCYACAVDSWNTGVSEGVVLLAGNPHTNGANTHIYGLEVASGHTRWMTAAGHLLYNFMPCTVAGFFVVSDQGGGLYCYKVADGSEVYKSPPDNYQSFTTAHSVIGPDFCVYLGHILGPEDSRKWNEGCGKSVMRAYDLQRGARKWEIDLPLEASVSPVVVPPQPGHDRHVVVIPLGLNPEFWHDLGGVKKAHGDAYEGWVVAYDCDTGAERWCWKAPVWRSYTCAGHTFEDYYLPDSWTAPTVDGRGTVYTAFQSGVVYALNGHTGELLSQYDTKMAATGAITVGPGMLVCAGATRLWVWLDPALEEEWLAQAAAAGDPRAAVGKTVVSEEAAARGLLSEAEEEIYRLGDIEYGNYTMAERIASAKVRMGGAAARAKAGDVAWTVVGGRGGAGGIVVRRGKDVKSKELPRLSTGARVRELELDGDRLHYEKVSGRGPPFGWVSLTFKGVPLLERQ